MAGEARRGPYVPVTEGTFAAFFAASRHQLHLQRCDACAAYQHPPRHVCGRCGSGRWSFVPSAGRGTIYSYVITHRSLDPAWSERVPFATVAVELEEGPRLVGALRGLALDELALGVEVVVVGEPKGEDFVFFWVEPATAQRP